MKSVFGSSPPACTQLLMTAVILLSQINPDTRLHPLHPVCAFFFTSLLHCPLVWMVYPRLTISPLVASHMYSVSFLLTFIPLLSSAYLHLSRPPFLLLPTLTTDHNIAYEHFSPWRLPSALICQPVHHHCRRSGSKSISDVIPPPLGNHLSLPIQYGILVLRLGSCTRRTLACGNVGMFLEFSCESAEISDALNSFHLNF